MHSKCEIKICTRATFKHYDLLKKDNYSKHIVYIMDTLKIECSYR